ncbi:MAG: hypothetical protein A2Z12_00595 [Actinobacteria bacterium RBG_16_68_21]|nr:MAG: hypothetical protein A2Z12_00595 [Actinobacteria bacterium RBG_16_68_21]
MTERRALESERLDSAVQAVNFGPLLRTRQAMLVVFILIVAGVFDAISGNPVDAVLLVSVGVLLAVFPDDAETSGEREGSRRRLGAVVATLALAGAFAIVVGSFERYTWPMTIGVLVPGVTALSVAWRGDHHRDPGPRLARRLVVAWMVVFVALGLFELTSLLLQPGLTIASYDHPTLSVLSDTVLNGHLGRSFGLFVWMVFGAYLLDR